MNHIPGHKHSTLVTLPKYLAVEVLNLSLSRAKVVVEFIKEHCYLRKYLHPTGIYRAELMMKTVWNSFSYHCKCASVIWRNLVKGLLSLIKITNCKINVTKQNNNSIGFIISPNKHTSITKHCWQTVIYVIKKLITILTNCFSIFQY